MDRLNQYRQLLLQLLNAHFNLLQLAKNPKIKSYCIFDDKNDQYMLFRTGWVDDERVQIPYLYVHLENNKFWIEEDYTEDGLATELLAEGVPHQDIVLAFRHPDVRLYTEFAVA